MEKNTNRKTAQPEDKQIRHDTAKNHRAPQAAPPGGCNTYREFSRRIYGGTLPRLELLAGVLSQTSWMQRRGPKGLGNTYFRELRDFFKSYRNHRAIRLAEKLTRRGFTYDAPLNFILGLTPLPELQAKMGFSNYLVNRAGGKRKLEKMKGIIPQGKPWTRDAWASSNL